MDDGAADEPADDRWTRTDRNAAVLSSMACDNDTGGLLRSPGIKYDPEDGFGAVPYETEGGYMPAFRGTDGGSDWGATFDRQPA